MAGEQLKKGDRVKLHDGREGEVTGFDGRKIGASGTIVDGFAKVRLDDGTVVDVGPTLITKL